MAFCEKAVWAKKLRVTGSVSGSRRTVNLFGQNITYRQKNCGCIGYNGTVQSK